MANARDQVFTYTYEADDGDSYNVDLTKDVGDAGGFEAGTPGAPGLPKHAKMRHVGIYQPDTGKRGAQPIAKLTNESYQTGADVEKDGRAWQVTGRIGEHFRIGIRIPG